MPQGVRLDREALHDYLWAMTDGAGRLRFDQSALAAELGVNRVTIARIMGDFVKDERVIKIKEGHRRVVMYLVIDPLIWRERVRTIH